MKSKKFIEPIVMIICALAIVITAICTKADLSVIIVGSLLLLSGILFLIFAIEDKAMTDSVMNEIRSHYEELCKQKDDMLNELQQKYITLTSAFTSQKAAIASLKEKLEKETQKVKRFTEAAKKAKAKADAKKDKE